MKAINFLLKSFAMVAFILLINPVDSTAQKMDNTVQQKAKSQTDGKNDLTYCDEMISKAYTQLESKANKTCSSAKTTIQCTHKRFGQVMYITLIAKPSSKGCKTTINIQDKVVSNRAPKSRGGAIDSADQPRDYVEKPEVDIEILQKQCPDGGVKLTAYMPGQDNVNEMYDFEWKVDDEAVEDGSEFECTDDKNVTLKVKDKDSGEETVIKITLDHAASDR